MLRRKELRVKAVLPVKVTGVDASARHFSLICHTLDLTYDSARVAGLSVSLMRGQTVFLHRFGVKAKFKVHWEGAGTRKGQYGLKALETEKALWGISLPQRKADEFWTQPTAKDRRRFPRYPCSGGLEVITVFEYPFWAELTDISATGVYAKTPSPLPRHTLTRIRVTVGEFLCEAHAESWLLTRVSVWVCDLPYCHNAACQSCGHFLRPCRHHPNKKQWPRSLR